MRNTITRGAMVTGTAAVALVLTASPALAHIGTSEDEVAAGSTTALGLTVGHGCEDSPTTQVAFQIPEGVNNAQPFAHAGWTVESEPETLSPPVTSSHGEEVTERTAVITFTAAPGNALPHDVRDTFTINFTAPDTPGETLWFKTIQTCEAGENAWIEEWDGEGEEPENLAPSVVVGEATTEGGHEETATETTEADAPDEEATATTETASSSEDDGDDALAVAALVVGGLGLAVGGVALARSRKPA
jgi:uncharacterized protein YcnI